MKNTKKIVLIGRPNVGKSSLFNALLGFRRAIVLDQPGTTVDLVAEKAKWANIELIDSQGIFGEGDTEILNKILQTADAFLFVVDTQTGATAFDRWIASEILKTRKPTLLLLNKADGKIRYEEEDFAELGFTENLTTSAAHRKNLELVKEWCLRFGDAEPEVGPEEPVIRVALIGRPNTGKSTLMNRLCGEDISIVSPIPHTTRDPITHELETHDAKVKIIDTAGIRRPRSQKEKLEVFSVQASTRMIRDCDVVLLCIASHEAVTDQDMRLLSLIQREGRPAVVLLNFWDRLKAEERKHFLENSEFTRVISGFKILQISGKTGMGTDVILSMVKQLYKKSHHRTKTSKVNEIIKEIIQKNPPPTFGRQNFNILYGSQVRVDPPSFVFFMNRKANLPQAYKNYLENQLKRRLGLKSQSLRVFFRESRR